MRRMRIETVPVLSDNYAYLLVDDASRTAVVVDPSEAPPVRARADALGVRIVGIWCTHHHWDHVGGVEELVKALGEGLPVLGSAYDMREKRIPRQTEGLTETTQLSFAGEQVELIDIPGHTLGAIAYVLGGALLSGDTLFLAGCGRVFEGTMPGMRASIAKLRALAPATRVYPGHEYTVSNLLFARDVEPDNAAVATRLADAQARRARGEPTVPGTLADELATNPFMRWDAPAVCAWAQTSDPDAVFTKTRTTKDSWKPKAAP